MKTTVEIPDGLLAEAKALARKRRTTLRQVLAEGVRLALDKERGARKAPFQFRDCSQELGALPEDWTSIRRVIYEGRGE